MATPFADPRTGQLYFRRAVPEALRAAFEGKAVIKVSLRTKDPADAKAGFAAENAAFETKLAEARRRLAEGSLLPTPAALIRSWCEGPAIASGVTGPQRLMMALMELDVAAGGRHSSTLGSTIYPPAIMGPAVNTDWSAIAENRLKFEALVADAYGGEIELVGSNWIRARWFEPGQVWRRYLDGVIMRIRGFGGDAAGRFSDEAIANALLDELDQKRTGDEEVNRARLAKRRPRTTHARLRPTLRLQQLFEEWKLGNDPRPQTALEYAAAIADFIDFAGDITVSTIDADILYDYRDEAAKLPATMPRADRLLPFTQRVVKHEASNPKCAAPTLKKRIGALQALLTYAFQQRWTSTNTGVGIKIVGYTKKKRTRRSFEDHELAKLCGCPLFTKTSSWNTGLGSHDVTTFWLFLLAITTGARLEEVGQVAIADISYDGHIVYLDIDEYTGDEEAEAKSVKTEDSTRLIPIHEKLIDLGFRTYVDALVDAGHTQLFPDLKENGLGKRTKEASQRINRIIDRHVSDDRRLVFHSLRHAFKAKGNDAGLTDRTLDQICGHAPVTTGGRYGVEPRIRTIYRELHQIDFTCIDWASIAKSTAGIKWESVVHPPAPSAL